jgi:hypothetical protein
MDTTADLFARERHGESTVLRAIYRQVQNADHEVAGWRILTSQIGKNFDMAFETRERSFVKSVAFGMTAGSAVNRSRRLIQEACTPIARIRVLIPILERRCPALDCCAVGPPEPNDLLDKIRGREAPQK